MTISTINKQAQASNKAGFVIQTRRHEWVIPNNAAIMKLLVEDQSIRPKDLKFSSRKDCQEFIRNLLLLALEDEYKSAQPSPLARFARDLIHTCQPVNN